MAPLITGQEELHMGGRSIWSIGVDGSGPHLVVAGTARGDWLSPGPIG